MRTARINLRFPDGVNAAKGVFYWTRTRILDVQPEDPEVADAKLSNRLGVLIHLQKSHADDVTLIVKYEGEPPRLAKIEFQESSDAELTAFMEQDLTKLIVVTIEEWLACRECHTRAHPDPDICDGRAFFLALDRQTNQIILEFLGGALAGVLPQLTNFQMKLLSRMDWLFWQNPPENCPVFTADDVDMLNRVCALIEPLMVTHLGTTDRILDAFDRFAAGLLRHDCGRLVDDGQGKRKINSCDADSAFVFLFAELAFAAVELGRAEWAAYLNGFVRMQQIYIDRWAPMPPPPADRYFSDYNEPNPDVVLCQDAVDIIVDDYVQQYGDDLPSLRNQMCLNLQELAPNGGIFP